MNSPAPIQISFALAEYEGKKKITRREVFLAKMEQVVPWSRLMQVIEPYYPKSGKRGRPPIGLQRMLRMYFVQQWYGLADEAVEDAVYDSQALRNFMGIDLGRTSVPDASTLMGFRHLLEAHDLTKAMLVDQPLKKMIVFGENLWLAPCVHRGTRHASKDALPPHANHIACLDPGSTHHGRLIPDFFLSQSSSILRRPISP